MTDVLDFDPGEEGVTAPSDKLEVLHKMLDEATDLQAVIDQLSGDLGAAQEAMNLLKTKRLPELMDELQMDDLTRNGYKIKINDFVSGSLPKDEEPRAKAIAWLEDHDGGELLKTDIRMQFPKSQHDDAKKIADKLQAEGYAVIIESGVHAATLQAFARERLRNGDDIDTEVLGLYTGRVAKIDKAKEKAPKKPKG